MCRTILHVTQAIVLVLFFAASVLADVDLRAVPEREVPKGAPDFTPVADVSPQSGDYSPTIPLEVLPGPAGQTPIVALVYSALRTNGPLGAGWGLSFESAIERKSRSGGLAAMATDDSFWIDGQKLIKMPDGTFRAEQADFTVYSQIELNGRLIGWTALKDGFARHYGMQNTFISLFTDVNAVEYRDEIESSGVVQGIEQVRWLLSETTSPFGAAIAYRYLVPSLSTGRSTLRHLPSKIIYGVSGETQSEIEFGYTSRDDLRVSRANGPKRIESALLRRIVVKRIDGTAAVSHYYVLEYQFAAHSPQSMLEEVKRLEVADATVAPSAAIDASASAESLARFAYQDSATHWGDRKPIRIVGDPPSNLDDIPASHEFFSLPMTGDMNGDARPDLIVFNDDCLFNKLSDDDIDLPGDMELPTGPGGRYECISDHRVYLNTVLESRSLPKAITGNRIDPSDPTPADFLRETVFVYNSTLSRQVTLFVEALHDLFLRPELVALEDLDRDGFVELISPGKLSAGGKEGWDPVGVSSNIASLLASHQFADIDGDGFVDLVGQSHYYPNSGKSPFFSNSVPIIDPVTGNHASTSYDASRAECLDASDFSIFLRSDFGVNGLNHLSSQPISGTGISAAGWVWRNTLHTDINGDGLTDRVTSFPFLQHETSQLSPDQWLMWRRNDALCGTFDQVFLGDGRGGFDPAGYGIGGPMQREQTFAQTRTVEDNFTEPESDTYTFNHYLNHFALADVNADGRNEITQFCDSDSQFLALSNQGLGRLIPGGSSDLGPGFAVDAAGDVCPDSFTTPMVEEFFGLSVLDYHYSTILDIDADGMVDLLQYTLPYGKRNVEVSNEGLPWESWENGAHWRKNLRGSSQNRLTSITWPHGGTTSVTWAWSAEDPDNHFAINLSHVKTLEGANGKFTFAFSHGAFDDGRFLGFGRVETLRPRGSTLVQTFFNSPLLHDKPSTEELYDAGGRLKNLRVHIPGSDRPNLVDLDGLELDIIPPYYNPLQRVCEFEFGAFNGTVPAGEDVDSFIARCEAFKDEEGQVVREVLERRSLFSVFRGGDPSRLAQDSQEKRELIALRGLLHGEDPQRTCASEDTNLVRAAPPIVCLPQTVRLLNDGVGSPSVATESLRWSPAPYRTALDLSFPAEELPDWGPIVIEKHDERMFVTEYDYDDDIGHVVEQRDLRAESTTSDSLIRKYEYSAMDPLYAGVHLLKETSSDRLGNTYEHIEYDDFVNGQWRTRTEHNPVSGATRNEKRTFTALGDLLTSSDRLGKTTTYRQGDCGLMTSNTDPVGYGESNLLDEVCRPKRVDTLFGRPAIPPGAKVIARVEITRDGYGRVLERRTDPAVGNADDVSQIIERFAYDAQSGSATPSAINFEPETDGSTLIGKTFVDGWGRTVKTVRCEEAREGGGTGLDALHPCKPGTQVVTLTTYDADTGDVATTVGPYLEGHGLRPVHTFTNDEFGRLVVDVLPDGGEVRYAYGLGRRSVTDALGRTTQVVFDTLSETITVGGVSRGGTIRDAFGLVTEITDAAAGVSNTYYDGYNRKRQETVPAVDVLASGAASPVLERRSVLYAYDDADQLLSKTDPNGNVVKHSYDAIGRLVSTWGPDGVEIERRTYTDGARPTRKVSIRDTRLGVSREEHLDGLGRVWKQVAFDGTIAAIDHDARGRVWRTTLPWGEVRTTEIHDGGLTVVETSTQGAVVSALTTTLDAEGRPLTVTDADGQVLTNEYDELGRLVTSRQGNFETEHRKYDAAGRAVEVRRLGANTCFTYDALDNVLVEETGCLPGSSRRALVKITRTYTPLDEVDTLTDGEGNLTDNDYDALGRLTATQVFDATGASRGRRLFWYDAAGNQTKVRDELGFVHRTEYDVYDRPILSNPPDAQATTITHSVDGTSWRVTSTAPTGEQTQSATDAMGRTWKTCGTDGLCLETAYTNGLASSRTRISAAGAVLSTRYVQYHLASSRARTEWDWLAPAEASPACGGVVPDGCDISHVERTWTAAGRPDTITDAQGNVSTYGYRSSDGSLVPTSVQRGGLYLEIYGYDRDYPIVDQRQKVDLEGTNSGVLEQTTWDRHVRPLQRFRVGDDYLEMVTHQYDGNGRRNFAQLWRDNEYVLITESFDPRGNPVTRAYDVRLAAGSHAADFQFTWHDNGQIESVTYPSGNTVTYNYAANTSRLLSLTAGGTPVFELQRYDAWGRPGTLRFDNGAVQVGRLYDTAGREQQRTIRGTTAVARVEVYAYDALSRLQSITATSGVNTASSVYAYGTPDRLLSETHSRNGVVSQSFTYTYDTPTGLRTSKAAFDGVGTVTTDYTYGAGSRLERVGATAIPWDGIGRQTGDAAGRSFVWGFDDQLVAIEEAGALVEANFHDVDGLRAVRTTPAGMEYFLGGPDGDVLEHVLADGGIRDYVRLPSGVVVATIDGAGAVTPVLNGITGSPYRIGERTTDHRYVDASAFGELISEAGTLDDDLSFHQMFESEADGIQIAGVRAYDTSTGRFLTTDPLGIAAAEDLVDAADLFRYARSNPVALHDASGYAPTPIQPLNPCLQTLEGGCRSNIGEQTYEEQRQAAMEAVVAEHYDKQRVYRDRFHAVANRAERQGEFPLDALVREGLVIFTPDGSQFEDASSTRVRTPAALERPTEPSPATAPPDTSAARTPTVAPAPTGDKPRPTRTPPRLVTGVTPPAPVPPPTVDEPIQDDFLEIIVKANPTPREIRRERRRAAREERRAERRTRREWKAAGEVGIGIYVAYPNYQIGTPIGRLPHLGHAGVILVNKHGITRYWEYGRYAAFGSKGGVLERDIPDLDLDSDGLLTEASLRKALAYISEHWGHGKTDPAHASIEGVLVRDIDLRAATKYVQGRLADNDNPDRWSYSMITGNTCNGFAVRTMRAGGAAMPDQYFTPGGVLNLTPHLYAEQVQWFYRDVHHNPLDPSGPVFSR